MSMHFKSLYSGPTTFSAIGMWLLDPIITGKVVDGSSATFVVVGQNCAWKYGTGSPSRSVVPVIRERSIKLRHVYTKQHEYEYSGSHTIQDA